MAIPPLPKPSLPNPVLRYFHAWHVGHGFLKVGILWQELQSHTYGKATLTWFEEIFEEY